MSKEIRRPVATGIDTRHYQYYDEGWLVECNDDGIY